MKILLMIMITTLAFAKTPVTITAYTSHKNQTQGNAFLTATGHHLKARDKKLVVAVSRDLFKIYKNKKIKLKIGKKIHHVVVRDTMAKRWKKKIDLYFWTDRKGALKFGKRHGHIL